MESPSYLIRQNSRLFVLIILSLFVTPFYFRTEIFNFGLGELGSINFVFLVSICLLLITNIRLIDKKILSIILIIYTLVCINDLMVNKDGVMTVLKNITITLIPCLIFSIRLTPENYEYIYTKILKTFNIFIIVIFIIGLVDPFVNFRIMTAIGGGLDNKLNDFIMDNTTSLLNYRYTSYIGHPLVTKDLFLIFYLANKIYFKKFNEHVINSFLVTVISLCGILLTGSKAGIILILFCILFLNVDKPISRYLYFINSIILIITMYFLGFFNNVINRFTSTSLTSGRSDSWAYLSQFEHLQFNFFSGLGENFSSEFSSFASDYIVVAAFEYPIRILVFKYGISTTLLILFIIFIYPILIVLKRKEFYVFACILVLIIDVNLYNGLIFKPDNMILYIVFIYFWMNINTTKRKINKNNNLREINPKLER